MTGIRPAGVRAAVLTALCLLRLPSVVAAQTPPPLDATGADGRRYEVHLLTMDRGDEVWELFGHNALLIRDAQTGEELAWNWGLFDFQQEAFIPRFLRGTMEYTMGPANIGPFLSSYVAANRTVYANEILLTDEEAARLDAFVRWNFQPENRAYAYDYFLDNCSTRLRDALDGVLGGWLRETFVDRLTPRSFRWHTRRLVQGSPWLDQGISFMFGTTTDRPITEWEATFLPMELLRLLEGVERPEAGGNGRPLLGPRQTLFDAGRPPAPTEPPSFSLLWIVGGLVLATSVAWLGFRAEAKVRWAQAGFLAAVTTWGVGSGLLGTLLVLGWLSHHVAVHWNLNLFYLSPMAFALPVLSLRLVRSGRKSSTGSDVAGARVGQLIAALAVAAALLQLTPFATQGNAEVIAIGLPVNLAFAWALTRFPAG